MGSNEGHAWVSLAGVGHVELSEGFFVLIIGIVMTYIIMGLIANYLSEY